MGRIPNADRDSLAQGVMGVTMALMGMPDIHVVMLAELVPERGEALWERFRAWRDSQPNGVAGFTDWFHDLLRENATTLIFPQGCALGKLNRMFLAREIVPIIMRTDDYGLAAHFGVEPQYSQVRNIACRGCFHSSCRHWMRRDPEPRRFSPPSAPTPRPSRPTAEISFVPSETMLAECRDILRRAVHKGTAKEEIKAVLRRRLPDTVRRGGNSVTVIWSSNPTDRKASIYINAARKLIDI